MAYDKLEVLLENKLSCPSTLLHGTNQQMSNKVNKLLFLQPTWPLSNNDYYWKSLKTRLVSSLFCKILRIIWVSLSCCYNVYIWHNTKTSSGWINSCWKLSLACDAFLQHKQLLVGGTRWDNLRLLSPTEKCLRPLVFLQNKLVTIAFSDMTHLLLAMQSPG